jgi:hypothetical protein
MDRLPAKDDPGLLDVSRQIEHQVFVLRGTEHDVIATRAFCFRIENGLSGRVDSKTQVAHTAARSGPLPLLASKSILS